MAFVSSIAVKSAFALPAGAVSSSCKSTPSRTASRCAIRMAWTKVATTDEVKAQGGKTVVKVDGKKILVKEFAGDYFAVSNNCSHMGLPLEGKVMKAKYSDDGCVTCMAHGTSFSLKTGEVKGEWCPNLPGIMGFMKKTPAPLPTYNCRVSNGNIEVDV
mmetsp:Transcript_13339/g.22813  ORF Transcript_13339/g.22813 Transcript_13339/m.22813 type:complete len:159 (+) Transcript_13339:100-576(+)|eukprot:CAMPEP_0184694078 /NCGR_PEP_ID=MMETSP0313-20130426/2136_1 /TAXON_ID=2792 /ORGANISM="Porphyridium aerugineum, Strain SAG 1380-2" /LENGTH=158 /DNA_ID=CAMNT_0027152303 /DNA_START=78 /DNA_END=554 /DNA_ORIENTATION=-